MFFFHTSIEENARSFVKNMSTLYLAPINPYPLALPEDRFKDCCDQTDTEEGFDLDEKDVAGSSYPEFLKRLAKSFCLFLIQVESKPNHR